jgi:hypothetical protein
MHAYRLSITEDLNQIPASTTPFAPTASSPYVDPRSPYPNWIELYSTFNAGETNYHAFEFQATHHMQHGLYFDANYTYAKNEADNQGDAPSSFAGEVNYGLPVTDRFNIKRNLGNVEGTRRNRMLLTGVYQLPFGNGRKYLNSSRLSDTFLGGWDLTTITLLETGPWLTPSITAAADQSNTNVVNRGALLRPDRVPNGTAGAVTYDGQSFLPTPPGAGRFGNAGVGILEGPGTAAVSLGVAKRFAITEKISARFETTFTNILNHTNFAPPPTTLSVDANNNPLPLSQQTFGQLTGPQTAENAGNRTGQAALRIEF